MVSLAVATQDPDYPAEISMVVSNRADAGGLVTAQDMGIPTHTIAHKDFASRKDHELAIQDLFVRENIELVCLAGYMKVLTDTLVAKWTGRMLNIHPSLLPSFPGLSTHERALQAGVRIHGCTVHFVNGELDGGPIIVQVAVPVVPGDTSEVLAARVLRAEHQIYPEVLKWVATGAAKWSQGRMEIAPELLPSDLSQFNIHH